MSLLALCDLIGVAARDSHTIRILLQLLLWLVDATASRMFRSLTSLARVHARVTMLLLHVGYAYITAVLTFFNFDSSFSQGGDQFLPQNAKSASGEMTNWNFAQPGGLL